MRSLLPSQPHPATQPTIWGLGPPTVYDHYWAAHGIQVVRQGEAEAISAKAGLFLLTPAGWFVHFHLAKVLSACRWKRRRLVLLTLWRSRESKGD